MHFSSGLNGKQAVGHTQQPADIPPLQSATPGIYYFLAHKLLLIQSRWG